MRPAPAPDPAPRPNLLHRLCRGLRGFARDTRGSITVEAALVLPLWIWGYAMSYQFFDAFREQSQNVRAAYTVSDMISRELNAIGPDYIDDLHDVFDYLTRSNHPTWMRVTSVYYDSATRKYKRYWSYSTDSAYPAHTDATIENRKSSLPNLLAGETVVVVETGMQYEPIFNVGLDAGWYYNFIPTRPRFASKVEYDSTH
ncbi:TadE/TadG family type IV pilus assembly protein [Frigidibacter oleivorans]|uniref:TadE/TadG family type IV pilus assembly protein n=1 Tax=Frigidibacter oleivorans TaxID=2487129 RepID=UPI000F8D2D2D|nr:pilus assembly protein [Frigidibacter oleivorans]